MAAEHRRKSLIHSLSEHAVLAGLASDTQGDMERACIVILYERQICSSHELELPELDGVLSTLLCGFPLLELVQALRPRPAMTMVETTAAIRFALKSSAPQGV